MPAASEITPVRQTREVARVRNWISCVSPAAKNVVADLPKSSGGQSCMSKTVPELTWLFIINAETKNSPAVRSCLVVP